MNSKTSTAVSATKSSESKPIVIYGGPLFDGSAVFNDGAVYIRDSLVAAAGDEEYVFSQIPKTVDIEVYDTLGCLITPGLINLRSHFYRSFATGLGFLDNSKTFWQKYEQCIDDEMVQLAVLTSILNAVKSGVTTIFDMHSSPPAILKILDNISSVISRSGIQAMLACIVTETYGEDIFNRSVEENRRFIETVGEPDVRGTFGVHFIQSPSERALGVIKDVAGNSGFQIHLNHNEHLKALLDFGLVNAKSLISSHSGFTDDDIKQIGERSANLVYTPETGLPPHQLTGEIKAGIGTGTHDNNLLHALRTEYDRLISAGNNQQDALAIIETLLLANTAIAQQFFPGKPGMLEKGVRADIAVFDYVPVTPINTDNYIQHLLLGMSQSRAKMVMTKGKFIYNDYTFLTLDDEIIIEESQKAARRLFNKFEKQ